MLCLVSWVIGGSIDLQPLDSFLCCREHVFRSCTVSMEQASYKCLQRELGTNEQIFK